MSTVNITFTLNEDTLKKLDLICERAGIDFCFTFNKFIQHILWTQSFPLYLSLDRKRIIATALKIYLSSKQYKKDKLDRYLAKGLLSEMFNVEHHPLELSKSELKKIRRLKGLRKQRASQTNSKSYRFRDRKRLKDELFICIQNYFNCGHSKCFEDLYKKFDKLEWYEFDDMVADCSEDLVDYIMKNVYAIDKLGM